MAREAAADVSAVDSVLASAVVQAAEAAHLGVRVRPLAADGCKAAGCTRFGMRAGLFPQPLPQDSSEAGGRGASKSDGEMQVR